MRTSARFLLLPLLLGGLSCSYLTNQRALENDRLAVELKEDASVQVRDKSSGAEWDIGSPRLVMTDKSSVKVEAAPEVTKDGDSLSYRAADGTAFTIRLAADSPSAELSVEPGVEVAEVFLIDQGLAVGRGEGNYYAVPKQLGLLIEAEGEESYSRRFHTYAHAGLSMTMAGAVRDGSALLVTWDSPYGDVVVDYSTEGEGRLTMSLALRKSAKTARIEPIGQGGYVEIARAYRRTAKERGHLLTLAEKVKENPKVAQFFGAADFKPFAYMRRVANTRWNKTDRDIDDFNFTFDECARLAEHYKNDLGIDRAMLILNGWINAGYDNKHPDVLPAAPLLGGDAGLAACSRRVKKLGWLFGLHDNYQDMYRDAPSWDESYLMRNEDGSLHEGGVWAGGKCMLICSRKSVELASRPQNVPGVIKICSPDVYFSDTVFASPLFECFSEEHPLTLDDDLTAKQGLCDYLRGEVGLFGSEQGRDWGVAHADYFEGLLSHRTGYQRPEADKTIIPLFELVFGDCIPIYTHQSDRPHPDEPEKILHHLLYAEMPVYYFGEHIYWKDPSQDYKPKPGSEPRLLYARGGPHGLIDQFIKNTYEVLSPVGRLTATLPMTDHRFLTADRQVEMTRFGDDVEIIVNLGESDYTVDDVTLPQFGFLVRSPGLYAFCATRVRGEEYAEPTMFVVNARDGKTIESSSDLRIYRAFGGRRVEVNGAVHEVTTEKIVSGAPSGGEV